MIKGIQENSFAVLADFLQTTTIFPTNFISFVVKMVLLAYIYRKRHVNRNYQIFAIQQARELAHLSEEANKEVVVVLEISCKEPLAQPYLKLTPKQKATVAHYAAESLHFHKINSNVPYLPE